MDILEIMKERHSVRSYTDKPIEADKVAALNELIKRINELSGLHIQLQTEEGKGFSGMMAKYGSFAGVKNYIVLAGVEGKDREIGYYGEAVVLAAQALGLNTCWVALTFNKKKAVYELNDGEKLYVVISLGYGANQGRPHKSKNISEISDVTENSPEWYKKGIDAVMLAPTAINQQKFYFSLDGDTVNSSAPKGIYTAMDLGIAQYHFDAVTNKESFGLKFIFV